MSLNTDFRYRKPPWVEACLCTIVLAIVSGAWLVSLGGLSLSWDALNHHFYLGWMAVEGSRLDWDRFAAGSMSCQHPIAYAPVFLLQRYSLSGMHAAMALALPAIMSAPAIWLIAWTLFPLRDRVGLITRFFCVVLAFISPLWWSLLDNTSNDIISALPMIWAFSLVVWRAACDLDSPLDKFRLKFAYFFQEAWWVMAGFMVGLALSLKISHIFSALGLATISLFSSDRFSDAIRRILMLTLGFTCAVILFWWPWAHDIWKHCGSPIYPMFTDLLRPFSLHLQ